MNTAKAKLLNFERDLLAFYQRNLFQFSGFAQNFELNQSGTCLYVKMLNCHKAKSLSCDVLSMSCVKPKERNSCSSLRLLTTTIRFANKSLSFTNNCDFEHRQCFAFHLYQTIQNPSHNAE